MFWLLFSTLLTLSSCLSRQYYFVDKNMNWTDAQMHCRQKYTDLATLDNAEDTSSLIAAVNSSYIGLAWIGLYDDLMNNWRWYLDDDTFYGPGERDYRKWSNIWSPEPNNAGGNEMCTHMYPQGVWNDLPCSHTLLFVCYNKATNSHVLIAEEKTVSDARQYCRQYHTDLAIIRNETENQQITNLLGGYFRAWIGLYRSRRWSDQSSSTYENWLTGQQDMGAVKDCIAVSLIDSGKWTDEDCNQNLPFFCYKDSALPTQALLALSSCLSRQYYFVDKNMNWTDAQTYCTHNYTDLATLDSAENTSSLIAAVNSSYNGLAWIGLYDDVVNGWRWYLDDGTLYGPGERNFRKWSNIWNKEPNNAGGNEMCTEIYSQGVWNDVQCIRQFDFLCYNKTTDSHVLIKTKKNASDARQYCRQYHTDLAIIRNETENQQITNLLNGTSNVWIGLYRTRQWSDQNNSTYENWKTGQPDNQGGVEHCTAVSLMNSGQWTDENCNQRIPFFCYKDSPLTTQKNVIRLRARFTSGRNLTDAEIENIVLLQLQTQLINKGLPTNIKLHLKKVLKRNNTTL